MEFQGKPKYDEGEKKRIYDAGYECMRYATQRMLRHIWHLPPITGTLSGEPLHEGQESMEFQGKPPYPTPKLTHEELCKIRERFQKTLDMTCDKDHWPLLMDPKDFLALRRATPAFAPWQLRMILGMDRFNNKEGG